MSIERDYRPQQFEAQPDDRGTQNIYGDPNKPYWEKTPKDWRSMLAIDYGDYYRGNAVRKNEDGTRTTIRTYCFTIAEDERPNYARQMIGTAMEAGYNLAARPIRVNNSERDGIYLGDDNRPAYELWLLFEERQGIDMQKPTGETPHYTTPAFTTFQETFNDPFVTQRGALEGINWYDDRGALAKLLNTPSYAADLRIPQATDQTEPTTQA